MTRRGMISAVLVAAGCLGQAAGPAAWAREPDGTLGLVRTPNNGMPALVLPGGSFEAILAERASLRLIRPSADGRFVGLAETAALTVTWDVLAGGMAQAHCQVPGDVPPGCYALEADAAGHVDTNVRAVYVFESFPEAYQVAHITDTHVGSDRHARSSEAIFRDVIDAVNASAPALVLVTGDLTENGALDQFRRFLEILDTCAAPTFVCPGNHDRQALHYEKVFAALTYVFWFGHDGYLAFDTKDYTIADGLGRQDADLQLFRRAIKPARWSVGFTHRYDPNMGMRSQIVLFVDNPLDVLLFGHYHRSNDENETGVPWGGTPFTMTPAAINGSMRLITVTSRGIHPGEPQRVAVLR